MVNSVRLLAGTQVLLRPGGRIQFGVHPARALVLELPEGVQPGAVLTPLLADLRSPEEKTSLYDALIHSGLPTSVITDLLRDLVDAGFAATRNGAKWPAVLVIGKGGAIALRGAVAAALRSRGGRVAERATGPRTTRWATKLANGDVSEAAEIPDLVILVGMEIPDTELLRLLRRAAVPFVGLRMRDGRGVLGPWCAARFESRCPSCVEAERIRADPARAALAIQLQSTNPTASRPVVDATIAVLMAHVPTDGRALAGVEVEICPESLTSVFHRIIPDESCPVCRLAAAEPVRI